MIKLIDNNHNNHLVITDFFVESFSLGIRFFLGYFSGNLKMQKSVAYSSEKLNIFHEFTVKMT